MNSTEYSCSLLLPFWLYNGCVFSGKEYYHHHHYQHYSSLEWMTFHSCLIEKKKIQTVNIESFYPIITILMMMIKIIIDQYLLFGFFSGFVYFTQEKQALETKKKINIELTFDLFFP